VFRLEHDFVAFSPFSQHGLAAHWHPVLPRIGISPNKAVKFSGVHLYMGSSLALAAG